MRRIALVACVAALTACAAAPAGEAHRPTRHERSRGAAPTTRLVPPTDRAHGELDCAAFVDQAAAQAALRAEPSDPHRLDADRDGIACEHLPAPRKGN